MFSVKCLLLRFQSYFFVAQEYIVLKDHPQNYIENKRLLCRFIITFHSVNRISVLFLYLVCLFAFKNYYIDINPFMTYYGIVFKEIAIRTSHLKREKRTAFRKY